MHRFPAVFLTVFEAKSLRTGSDAPCRSFIKVTVVPDKTNSLTQQTQPVESGSNPQFNETILLNLSKIRHVRRILISVYCQLNDGQESSECWLFGLWCVRYAKQFDCKQFITNRSGMIYALLESVVDCSDELVVVLDSVACALLYVLRSKSDLRYQLVMRLGGSIGWSVILYPDWLAATWPLKLTSPALVLWSVLKRSLSLTSLGTSS
ncbi:regulator of G protein signaling 3 rgs3 [Clonorchis sinensis]|uniref:Regulator of G protein signaling 3 rgs3 n=1 Tax=Clonorchis sinensis TaxID=79923 RepID=G7YU86_CLOSI|nr:regulator of G protein signaling 3 rgs3 [Clonorchis sinensis]